LAKEVVVELRYLRKREGEIVLGSFLHPTRVVGGDIEQQQQQQFSFAKTLIQTNLK